MTRASFLLMLVAIAVALMVPFRSLAQRSPDTAELTPAQVQRQMTDRGFDVRSITRKFGLYMVEVATIDGKRTVFMGVDPRTGQLLPHAFINPAPTEAPKGDALM